MTLQMKLAVIVGVLFGAGCMLLALVLLGAGGAEPFLARTDLQPAPSTAEAAPLLAAPQDNQRQRPLPASATGAPIEVGIALAAAAVTGLREVRVEISEATNPNARPRRTPWRAARTLPVGRRTPRCRFADVPFSDYGYQVRVLADGRNGSAAFVPHTASAPAPPLVLTVLPAAEVTVELRDEGGRPVPDLPVFLTQDDRRLQQCSNAHGRAVFTGVLEGRYRVCVGEPESPRNEPPTIDVVAGSRPPDTTVTLAAGVDVGIFVLGPTRAIAGARVTATSVEELPPRHYRGLTGDDGRCRLLRLPPGRYLLRVEAEGHRVDHRRIEVVLGRPDEVTVDLELE